MKPPSVGQRANTQQQQRQQPQQPHPLMINALMWPWLLLMLLLSITMSPTAVAITASLPLELPSILPLQHFASSNYHEQDTEAFAGLAGYTRDYYGTATAAADRQPFDGDLAPATATTAAAASAAAPYANYEPKAVNGVASTASGFVQSYNNRVQPEYAYRDGSGGGSGDARHQGKIDFVINTANYEEQPAVYYQSYAYRPRASLPTMPTLPRLPLRDYHIEQFSNYRHATTGREQEREKERDRERERVALQPRQAKDDSDFVYAAGKHHTRTLNNPFDNRQQQQQQEEPPKPHPHQEDQQLLYSQAENHIADLPHFGRTHNALPPITTSVHHTAMSSKAIAGLPLAKHIEVTRHLPLTHYQRQHVPYRQTVQLRVPRPVITTIPKPVPIKVPVSRTVAVPQLQEVKIPVEKIKPVAVERPIPFVVERRVPYRVEKPVATPIYYPYPVKVPIVRTVVHKQRPQYALQTSGLGSYGGWSPGNHLLG